ncbi:MAG: tyrosine-type recombinase/integrase [Pirellulaceae bacterium]
MQTAKSKTTRINLSKTTIEALKPPQTARVYVYDTKQPGLAICITSAGTRTFYVYRKLNGRPERVRLGAWPEMTVAQARTVAARDLGQMVAGIDPNAARKTNRSAPTFREMFDEFVELPTRTRAKRPKSLKTIKDYRLQFEGYLADWHGRKISTVSRVEIEKLHNRLAAGRGQYTANRVLALVKALYATAIDLGYLKVNPATGVRPFEEETRERFLSAEELPRFFAAVAEEPSEKVRDFIWLALFTGQRRGNVLAMKWADVNLDQAIWIMPSTKTGRHEVPLTQEALDVLRRRQRAKGASEYVLPGRHERGHLMDPMRQWRGILERAGIANLRIHDLRRSLGSWQAITGASLQVVGKTLGHRRPETTAIYSRLSDDPVRSAMATATAAMVKASEAGKGTAK